MPQLKTRSHTIHVPWFASARIDGLDDLRVDQVAINIEGWSPERIATWHRRKFTHDRWMRLPPVVRRVLARWTRPRPGPRQDVVLNAPRVYSLKWDGEGTAILAPHVYGLDPTGAEDSTEGLQTTVNIAGLNCVAPKIIAGTYRTSAPIVLGSRSGLRMEPPPSASR